MTEVGEQLAVTCPACSPELETVHEVLSNGGQPTVRCRDCSHVHVANVGQPPDPRTVRTIVSQDGESVSTTTSVPPDVELSAGDRFVVETDDAAFSVELTSIEDAQGRRHDRLPVEDVETLWTRDIGNVAVDVTVHPPKRSNESSRSTSEPMPGDREIVVGDTIAVDGEDVTVIGVLLREPAVAEDGDRKLDRTGATAQAMDVERVYARAAGGHARDPW